MINKDIDKIYCDFCEADTIHKTTIEDTHMNIEGVEFRFNEIKDSCAVCGREGYVESHNILNVENAGINYKKRLNHLTSKNK